MSSFCSNCTTANCDDLALLTVHDNSCAEFKLPDYISAFLIGHESNGGLPATYYTGSQVADPTAYSTWHADFTAHLAANVNNSADISGVTNPNFLRYMLVDDGQKTGGEPTTTERVNCYNKVQITGGSFTITWNVLNFHEANVNLALSTQCSNGLKVKIWPIVGTTILGGRYGYLGTLFGTTVVGGTNDGNAKISFTFTSDGLCDESIATIPATYACKLPIDVVNPD